MTIEERKAREAAYQRDYRMRHPLTPEQKAKRAIQGREQRARQTPEQKARRVVYNREWRAAVRAKDPEAVKESYRRKYWKHVEKNRELSRWYKIRRSYGIRKADFERMERAQDGECAICQQSGLKLVIDHDHSTKKIRGLLCLNCNSVIGHAKDNQATLWRAMTYLQSHQSVLKIA